MIEYLADHPLVIPPFEKEINFFGLNWGKDLDWYKAHFPLRATRKTLLSVRAKSFLPEEGSVYYLFHPEGPLG